MTPSAAVPTLGAQRTPSCWRITACSVGSARHIRHCTAAISGSCSPPTPRSSTSAPAKPTASWSPSTSRPPPPRFRSPEPTSTSSPPPLRAPNSSCPPSPAHCWWKQDHQPGACHRDCKKRSVKMTYRPLSLCVQQNPFSGVSSFYSPIIKCKFESPLPLHARRFLLLCRTFRCFYIFDKIRIYIFISFIKDLL